MSFQYHTKPYKHQREWFERTRDLGAHAVFWEQGTGKTKFTLDTAMHLWEQGKIDTIFVIAPNGVHRNWTAEEIVKHFRPDVLKHVYAHTYHSSKASTKRHAAGCKRAIEHKGLTVATMGYEAFRTKLGKAFAQGLLKQRGGAMFILDESLRIKAPGGKTSRAIRGAARFAEYRRILTGTPASQGPLDVYAQILFLDPNYWKDRGFGSFVVFRNYFAIYRQETSAGGKSYNILVGYKNVDELNKLLEPISSRVTKDDVLDLPPKIYSKRFCTMTPRQTKAYEAMRDEYYMETVRGEVTADLALTRLLRLHQIACGYVTTDEGDIVDVDDQNPRLQLLSEVVDGLPPGEKAIIWAKFTRDIDKIMESLGDAAVRYDGKTSTDDRAESIERFQRGDARFFVAHQKAAGTGLTLHAASTVIYYSNDFNLADRLQSEDRAHRIGQTRSVNYIDLVVEDTVDERVVELLVKKKSIADAVTGDRFKEWL